MIALLLCLCGPVVTQNVDAPLPLVLLRLVVDAGSETPEISNFQLYLDDKPSTQYIRASFRLVGYATDLSNRGSVGASYTVPGFSRILYIKNDLIRLTTTTVQQNTAVRIVITAEGHTRFTATATGKHQRFPCLAKRAVNRELTRVLLQMRATGISLYRKGDATLAKWRRSP